MAEVITILGVAASIVQLADYGIKLSIKLFSYSQAVSSAYTSIKELSNDVSLTSTILQELSGLLKSEHGGFVSESAIEVTQRTVQECQSVFKQLNEGLEKSLVALGVVESEETEKAKRGRMVFERLKWPFRQSKMELLRGNLERLKGSLTLMLQVLNYAGSISNRKEMEISIAHQKHLIENLARSEEASRRKYLDLQKAFERNTCTESDGDVSLSTGSQSKQTNLENSTAPQLVIPSELRPKILMRELFLCFHLLNDLLTSTPELSRIFKDSPAVFEQFKDNLRKLILTSLQRSEHDNGVSNAVNTQACRNLHTRLETLTRIPGPLFSKDTDTSLQVMGPLIKRPSQAPKQPRSIDIAGKMNLLSPSSISVASGNGARRASPIFFELPPRLTKNNTNTERGIENGSDVFAVKPPAGIVEKAESEEEDESSVLGDEEEDVSRNVVWTLLAEWTTIPLQDYV